LALSLWIFRGLRFVVSRFPLKGGGAHI